MLIKIIETKEKLDKYLLKLQMNFYPKCQWILPFSSYLLQTFTFKALNQNQDLFNSKGQKEREKRMKNGKLWTSAK